MRTVYGLYSGESLPFDTYEPPDKVIIFVDELNKYAPARGQSDRSPILDQVLDVAERGRSFGIILFSAQQFMSAVHGRVTGNSATKVLGRTDSAEINTGNYRFLAQDIRNHLTRLDKGELILSHPIYRQPVKIHFPRPAYQTERAIK
jgi:DNA helicase HerA-like ATPase